MYICYDIIYATWMLEVESSSDLMAEYEKNSALFFPGQYVVKNIVMEKFLETYFISNIEGLP